MVPHHRPAMRAESFIITMTANSLHASNLYCIIIILLTEVITIALALVTFFDKSKHIFYVFNLQDFPHSLKST